MSFSILQHLLNFNPDTSSTAFQVGKVSGGTISILGCFTSAAGGTVTEYGGYALEGSGEFAAAGEQLVIVSPAAVAWGASAFWLGTAGFITDASALFSGGSDGYSGDEKWNKGSFESSADSLDKHYAKHGSEVGANDADQYLRKAIEFSKNLKGAQKSKVSGAVEGVIRYVKMVNT